MPQPADSAERVTLLTGETEGRGVLVKQSSQTKIFPTVTIAVSRLLGRRCESDNADHLLSFYTGGLSYVKQNWLHL